MSNSDKYDAAFVEVFGVEAGLLPSLKYQSIPEWDSVGHMSLVATLEESFDVELEMDDILDFSSYERGKEILGKYSVDLG